MRKTILAWLFPSAMLAEYRAGYHDAMVDVFRARDKIIFGPTTLKGDSVTNCVFFASPDERPTLNILAKDPQ